MGFFSKILDKLSTLTGSPSASDLADFERILIASDLGPKLTAEMLELIKRERSDLAERIKAELRKSFLDHAREINVGAGLTTIMMVGVNGTGKTTTVAKLASRMKSSGERVLLTAADTFRAAAIDQLETWADRVGVEIASGKAGSDPASVVFDGAKRAVEENFTVHIIDTAGRLHTESNLMSELAKVHRVAEKVAPVNEVLLVLDGTVGQNAIVQAREFMAAVPVTGLVLTKLDGSAKGGAAIAIERDLAIPIKLIGLGEALGDLKIFDPDAFLDGLLL